MGLVVQAAYHLAEFGPLRDALEAVGIGAELLVPVPERKPLHRFRPGYRRYRELLEATDRRVEEVIGEEALAGRLASVVVMNDWGVPRHLVERMRRAGRPTFAWIEGVQDFDDVDTGQARAAYTHVDHVFCLGEYGAGRLHSGDLTIVGSERLRELWSGPPARPEGLHAVVNSNFTYGVMTEHRRAWLGSVAAGCDEASMPWTLSRHTAERGCSRPRASPDPISELLTRSTHLIGRFSTVCYEALVLGVELVYHNPHGEQEPTFRDSAGAFSYTTSAVDLAARLRLPTRPPEEIRAAASDFLHHHLRLEDGPAPGSIAAGVIAAELGR